MTIPAVKRTNLDLLYNYSPVLCLLTSDLSSYTVTADSGTDTFTAVGHDFINGVPVRISNSGGSLPGGVATSTYYVRSVSGDDFQLSETIGGSAIAISSNGSGTNTVTEVDMGDGESAADAVVAYSDPALVWDILVRHEVNYQGGGRVSFTWDSATQSGRSASIPEKRVSIIPSTGSFTFSYIAVIRDGNTTQGDATGSVAILKKIGDTVVPLQGYTYPFTITSP